DRDGGAGLGASVHRRADPWRPRYRDGTTALPTIKSRSLRILTLVPDPSLASLRVVRELDRVIETRGCPRTIVSDNGTEFTSNAILAWQEELGTEGDYIAP